MIWVWGGLDPLSVVTVMSAVAVSPVTTTWSMPSSRTTVEPASACRRSAMGPEI
ncbi:hypothetical protein [Mycolicibacterium chlorophenolicum]|uniref:hypothetical protein n=1 Tax=Mycolicibacterium chlorophenolicum TaxID=37916 RepID=UPI003898F212